MIIMNEKQLDYDNYLSPFSWRYGSDEMRSIWSEVNKRKIWRRIWVALAEVQAEHGLVTLDQVADLRAHAVEINLKRALEIESETRHDVMAEVKTFAEQCPIGGGVIHLGMTSMDVVDNADALRVRQSIDLILARIKKLLISLIAQVEHWADTAVMGFTHLQPAEPSTLGYRFAQYAQDFWMDWQNLSRLRGQIKGKGLKGAVGTSASYIELLGVEALPYFEAHLSKQLDLEFFPVTTQVYPRKQDYDVISALAGFGASIHKFAFDLRILQSPPFGELAEPFGKKQVGSSAMPFKRNPVKAESSNSLARLLAQMARVAWDNAALTLLERTIDDSANRRTSLPEAFLIADELLSIGIWICDGLRVDEGSMAKNLAKYGPFAATERVLMALGKAGANRQVMHEHIRQLSLQAWEAQHNGQANPLIELITTDVEFLRYLSADELLALMDASSYIGDASQRAKALAKQIENAL
jgi:adenylosuccinate lyase